jgi:hypothetical protein
MLQVVLADLFNQGLYLAKRFFWPFICSTFTWSKEAEFDDFNQLAGSIDF